MDLDDFDRRLLNLVQSDAGQTAEQLAGDVGLSASAVQRRLKRLREAGVIIREAAILDPRASEALPFSLLPCKSGGRVPN